MMSKQSFTNSATRKKVAVITPFASTPVEYLIECNRSVLSQTYPATHIVISDGPDWPIPSELDCVRLSLEFQSNDYGDTPRASASQFALENGFDAIAYLDADNWYYPRHVESLVNGEIISGSPLGTTKRIIHRLDGTPLCKCLNSGTPTFCDSSCAYVSREAFELLSLWSDIPSYAHAIGDRFFWHYALRRGFKPFMTNEYTVAYRAKHRSFYLRCGEQPPPEAIQSDHIAKALLEWESRGLPDLREHWQTQSLNTESR
jgi:hypothetical protein